MHDKATMSVMVWGKLAFQNKIQNGNLKTVNKALVLLRSVFKDHCAEHLVLEFLLGGLEKKQTSIVTRSWCLALNYLHQVLSNSS